ncbi:TonB-dependent receptor [Cystobacter ferrugineus]|uniref:TonB-dependent receptor n=1 Tax=Cystobacter ferrugineus TaxID=83449 RepID=A0A1L9B136_9BACT|nr:TonB-dependent siderophore receptor [Cystobacter ferrugineus]OJH35979.1 TonB-dependent receptor [Cystobacter ferrugineus]
MSSKLHTPGIRATKGLAGGVRGRLWPLGQAAGLASALAAGGALAQESTPPAETPRTESPAAQAAPSEGTENTFVLPTVKVQEAADPREYHTEQSGLTRLPQPLINTPQSVTVVPEKVIEEQNATTVRDALRNVSGITVSAGEGGRQGDTFNLRGFSAQSDTFRDGVRDLGWFTRDTFNLGGVEVFFGPSAVLFGRGSTGGAVNLTTKRPSKRAASSVSLTGGTAPSGRLEVDVNSVISERVQARINVLGQLANIAGRDDVSENRLGFAPSLTIALGQNTSLDFDYFYQHEQSVPDYGHPYYQGGPVGITYGVGRDVFYGVRGEDRERVNAHVATARFQHRFGEGRENSPRLTNTLRLGGVDRFSRPTSPRGLVPAINPQTIGRERYQTDTDNLYLINQTDLRGELQTGIVKQTANIGLELSRESRDQYRDNLTASGASPNLPANLFDPEPRPDLSTVNRVFSGSNESRQWNVGVYAADQISISRFVEVLGSARVDVFRTRYSAVDRAGVRTNLENKDTLFNWRVGLVLHPLDKTSVYAMYGTSSNPSAEAGALANNNATLEPETNQTYEIGAKAELLESRLGLNASVFRIEKTNARVANSDPTQPQLVLEGAQRVQGYNVGVTGQITSAWRVLANYTHLDSDILEHTNPYLVGQPLPNTPKRSLSLWTTVSLLDGLTLGGGAVYQDVTTVNNPTSAAQSFNKVPNYWRFDAFASYSLWERLDLQLNVNNLTNRFFYDQYYSGQAIPAAARTAFLTARVHF